MPRGIYKRKKRRLPLSTDDDNPTYPTIEERTDSKRNDLIQQIISAIMNQLNLLRELTNG
jgi:hypothetical protein